MEFKYTDYSFGDSWIPSVWYNRDNEQLAVVIDDDHEDARVYVYEQVPLQTYAAFTNAESWGAFYNYRIKHLARRLAGPLDIDDFDLSVVERRPERVGVGMPQALVDNTQTAQVAPTQGYTPLRLVGAEPTRWEVNFLDVNGNVRTTTQVGVDVRAVLDEMDELADALDVDFNIVGVTRVD